MFSFAARPAGKLLYDACVARPRLKAYELLAALPSCRPPSEQALAGALPRLSARYYSVASSPLTQDGAARKEIVSLCFSVVKYEAGAGTNAAHSLEGADRVYARKGLCTTWLDELVRPVLAGKTITDKVPCFLKPSEAFALPEDPDAPILMVGPGTGVAPFVGFLEHRARKRRATAVSAPPPPPSALPGARPAYPARGPRYRERGPPTWSAARPCRARGPPSSGRRKSQRRRRRRSTSAAARATSTGSIASGCRRTRPPAST